MTKTVIIIVEGEILEKPLYFGKSGDLAIIDYFLRKSWRTVVMNANALQGEGISTAFEVKNNDYTENFYACTLNECWNIINEKTPATNSSGLVINIEFKEVALIELSNFLLISRAMPQSITNTFLQNFQKLSSKAGYVPQNLEDITLYKDKTIPYLLQKNNDNIEQLYEVYSTQCKKFKTSIGNGFNSIALNTNIIDISKPFKENHREISKVNGGICIKPFNLFGGIGVKLFKDSNQKQEIQKHLQEINQYFTQYGVNDRRLALVQEAVSYPEFGDIRILFSFGRFLGAFKRIEKHGKIHNTMHGGVIAPVCNSNMEFHHNFEKQYHKPFADVVAFLRLLNEKSSFLRNEFICGYDLLLTQNENVFQFKLTETNIPCPTGFSFLDSSLIASQNEILDLKTIETYFKNNTRTVDITLDCLVQKAGF